MTGPATDDPAAYRLTGITRVTVGLFGFAAAGAGVIAVFGSSKELGAAVLLIIGTIFAGMAILGVVPRRFGLGNWGVDIPGPAAAIAEAVGTGLHAEQDVEQATISLPPALRDETRIRAASYIAYERSVLEAVSRIAPEAAAIKVDQRTPEGWRVDAMVVTGGLRAYVEVKRLGDGALHVWRRIAAELFPRAASSRIPFVLVVDRRPPTTVPMWAARGLVVVEWRDQADDPVLRDAIEGALTRSGIKTLHAAISFVLREAGRPMTIPEIRGEIERLDLYRSQTGALPPAGQIVARISRYGEMFRQNDDGTIGLRGKG
jgi:hypothetical protein